MPDQLQTNIEERGKNIPEKTRFVIIENDNAPINPPILLPSPAICGS